MPVLAKNVPFENWEANGKCDNYVREYRKYFLVQVKGWELISPERVAENWNGFNTYQTCCIKYIAHFSATRKYLSTRAVCLQKYVENVEKKYNIVIPQISMISTYMFEFAQLFIYTGKLYKNRASKKPLILSVSQSSHFHSMYTWPYFRERRIHSFCCILNASNIAPFRNKQSNNISCFSQLRSYLANNESQGNP